MQKVIGRVVVPTVNKEVIKSKTGDILFEGKESTYEEAKMMGNLKAWAFVSESEVWRDLDDRNPPPGYRVQVIPSKAIEKGKQRNQWEWRVRKIIKEEDRKVLAAELRFPGYILVRARFDHNVFHMICSCRGVMGFLPLMMPLVNPRRATRQEEENRAKWKPTALDSERAAELLLEQTEFNRQRKEENKCPILEYKVGSKVQIIAGAFENLVGTVTQIEPPENNPIVHVEFMMLGTMCNARFKHHECRLI